MRWIIALLGKLMGFIPFVSSIASTIQNITKQLVDLRVIEAQAQTDKSRIEAQENIKVLEAQRDLLIAQNSRDAYVTTLVRVGLTFPVAIVLWKVLVFDKVIGSLVKCSGVTDGIARCMYFTTDKLDANGWWYIYVVVGFWFVQTISSAWKRPT